MSLAVQKADAPRRNFDSAEMGAIAHLYRGEVYRSTIWRTRLDNTTNWSIVANNYYGPIVNRTGAATAAVTGDAAASTLATTDPSANFTY